MGLKKSILLAGSILLSTSAFALGGASPGGGSGGSGGSSSGEDGRWERMIRKYGGTVKRASSYSFSASGFNQYLRDSGIEHYDAWDLIVPNSRSAANNCGLNNLLPSRSDWVRGAALTLWVEEASKRAGAFPRIRNWYRPPCYNSAVGGASRSDHIQARALDVDFASSSQRRRAQSWLCSAWRSDLNMQIGLGAVTIHLGAESPYGKRNWFYGSYGDSDKYNTCFDR